MVVREKVIFGAGVLVLRVEWGGGVVRRVVEGRSGFVAVLLSTLLTMYLIRAMFIRTFTARVNSSSFN